MKNYSVLKADLREHQGPVIDLKSRNLKRTSEEDFLWKYANSPSGQAACWLAREGVNRSFVGATALFPRVLWWEGARISASVAGDFSMDEQHRSGGPALMLQREAMSNIDSDGSFQLIYGIPNAKAIPIFRRIGFARLGTYMRYRKILSFNYREGKSLIGIASVRGIMDAGLKYLSRETYQPKLAGTELEPVTRFDERYDVLWEKASRQFVVAGERSATYLNWRYFGHPKRRCDVRALVRNRGEVLGYVAYHVKDNVSEIVDILCEKDGAILNRLVASFLSSMRDDGIGSVEISCLGSTALVRRLKKFNFIARPASACDVMIYLGKRVPRIERLLDETNWYFLKGDTDSDLVDDGDN